MTVNTLLPKQCVSNIAISDNIITLFSTNNKQAYKVHTLTTVKFNTLQ